MSVSPLFVREDIEAAPRRHLFTMLGIPWTATPHAWTQIIPNFALGVMTALIFVRGSFGEQALYGLLFGLLLMLTNVLHSLGHIISGKWIGFPMDENLITSSRHVNIYRSDPPNLPGRVHLARALGGPLMNISIGLLALLLWVVGGGPAALFFALVNLGFGFGSFAPIPSVDGEVIWRELRR